MIAAPPSELSLSITETGKLPAFLSPRDVSMSPTPRPELCAQLEALQAQEHAVRYRQALLSALDTELPATPATGARATAKRRAQAVLRAGARPQRMLPDGTASSSAPSAFESYKAGARLAKVGMDYEAAANFAEGLWHHPESDLLRSAFDHTIARAKCSCRQSWARPCPPPSKWKDRDGHDERVRGVTWSCCPACGTCWPDNPRLMFRMRKRKDGTEEIVDLDGYDEGGGGPQRSREVQDMLDSLSFDDLLPREPRRPNGRGQRGKAASGGEAEAAGGEEGGVARVSRDRERESVRDALAFFYPDLKAIHAHYSNQNGQTEEQLLGASAFTMDRRELNKLLSDCGLFPSDNKYLTYNEISLIFTRVNCARAKPFCPYSRHPGPLLPRLTPLTHLPPRSNVIVVCCAAGSGADGGSFGKASPTSVRTGFGAASESGDPNAVAAFNAKVNNYDDSEAELTVAEFAHLLLRVSQARLPLKRRSKDVAAQFIAMMETFVLPNAKRDELAFLRDALTTDRQLRHVTYMYRHKLGAIFRKHCGPQRGDRSDKTRRDHMSLRSFTELLKRTGVQELAGASLKELTLAFAQSQSEAYDSFEGAVDVEMSYGEFLEALLRLGVRHRAGSDGIAGVQLPGGWLRDAMVPVMAKLCGEMEGGKTKLSWHRLQRLIMEENERLAEIKVGMMVEDFSVVPAGRPDLPPPPDEQVQWEMSTEAVFRRMLEALEREGDVEAGRQPAPAQLSFKPNAVARHSKLRNLGMAVRMGLRLGDGKAAGAGGGLGGALAALKAMQDAPAPKMSIKDLIKKEKAAPPPLLDVNPLAGL